MNRGEHELLIRLENCSEYKIENKTRKQIKNRTKQAQTNSECDNMLKSSNICTVSVTTSPLRAAVMLKWPSVKMSLTPSLFIFCVELQLNYKETLSV